MELFQAEVVGVQVVLEFGDPVLDIGAPIVVAPDLFRRIGETGDEDPEGVARHLDPLAAQAGVVVPDALADHHELPLGAPAVQLEAKLAHGVVGVQFCPVLNSLRLALDPLGQTGDYNVRQTTLFEEAQQFVVEETGIGSDQTDRLTLSPERQGFFEKLDHSPAGAAVAAAEVSRGG